MSAEPAVALQEPVRTLSITEEAFCTWLGRAVPRQRIEYHRGSLLVDRSKPLSLFADRDRRELSAIANRAFALAQEGWLCLVQKRHGDFDYGYIAIVAARSSTAKRGPRCAQGGAR